MEQKIVRPKTRMAGETKMLVALFVSIVLTVGSVATLSFILSYEALWNMALIGGKAKLSWMWPLIIDMPLIAFSLVALYFTMLGVGSQIARFAVLAATLLTVAFNFSYAVLAGLSWQVVIIAPIMYAASFEFLVMTFRHTSARWLVVKSTDNLQAELDNERATVRAELDNSRATFEGQKDKLISEIGQLEGKLQGKQGELETIAGTIKSKQAELKKAKEEPVQVIVPDNLTPPQRQSLVKKLSIEGQSNETIAKLLQVSASTIKGDKRILKNGNGHKGA